MTPSVTIVLGLVLIVVGIPMIRKRVPRIDGLLMPHLAIPDDVYYESHRRSGWDFVMIGAGLIVLAIWALRAGSPAGVRDFLGVCAVVALLIAAVRSVVVTLRLAEERDITD